eukprot:GFUD01029342.1.p1 GENE.GFUD01029342.1~~GFUD01029342.1.p1  ORF type:complete len:735 (-),score=169.50 GFUD01029342.1:1651-3855(-)
MSSMHVMMPVSNETLNSEWGAITANNHPDMDRDNLALQQEKMINLKPHAQVHLLSPVDKCKVCGEPAAKHIHYGAMSCFSCRAFFRRSIQNRTANTYICRRTKDCQINLKTRKNCQFCRYERCLAVGMKPSWVLSPDERERRFRKNKAKKFGSEHNDPSDNAASEPNYENGNVACTQSASGDSEVKQEYPAVLVQAAGQQDLVKSELLLYSEDSKASVSRVSLVSPPVVVERACRSVEVPATADRMFGKEILPMASRTSLISAAPHPNFYVYSSTSQHLAAATPVSSTRRDEVSSSIIVQRSQFSGNSGHGYSVVPSLSAASPKQSNNLLRRSPGVIVKSSQFQSQYLGDSDQSRIVSHQSQSFSQCPKANLSSLDAESVAAWNLPSSSRDIPCNASLMYSGSYTASSDPIKKCYPMVTQASGSSSISSYSKQSYSSYPRSSGSSPPMNEFSDESEYEDSVYSKSSDDERSIAGILSEPEIKFSDEEYNQLKALVGSHDERYKSVNFGEELIKEMIMCSMFGIPISTSAAISGYRLTVERITRIANNLDCFVNLPMMDQTNLLKENADLLVSLRGAIFFDSKKKGVNQVLISMGIDDLETIKTMFSPLMKEKSMKHIDYKIFNSIQKVESDNSVEQRYNFLQGKVAELIGDEITTILLTYIILFSVDFCSLQDSRRVELLQEQFIRMLERYVYSKTSRQDACNTLANSLNAVTCIREMADIKKSRAINQAVKIN